MKWWKVRSCCCGGMNRTCAYQSLHHKNISRAGHSSRGIKTTDAEVCFHCISETRTASWVHVQRILARPLGCFHVLYPGAFIATCAQKRDLRTKFGPCIWAKGMNIATSTLVAVDHPERGISATYHFCVAGIDVNSIPPVQDRDLQS